jgi:hypothetical protein
MHLLTIFLKNSRVVAVRDHGQEQDALETCAGFFEYDETVTSDVRKWNAWLEEMKKSHNYIPYVV